MNYTETLGIDVSKETLDAHLYVMKSHRQFKNTQKGFTLLRRWLCSQVDLANVIICFEHTGLYALPLALFLEKNQITYCMESALQIKKSMGITRGKSDRVDSYRIAAYAYQRRDQLQTTRLPSQGLLRISRLLALRDRMVKQRSGYKANLCECKSILVRKENQTLFKLQEQSISFLNKKIKNLEKEILEIMKDDQIISKQYNLITSVKGVGFVLATHMLVLTHCFTRFSDSRKFACYSGVAPFPYQSGTSINSKSKVNPMANKKIKTLLNMAAMVAIQRDPEIQDYYERRISIGKSPMSSINVIRNKIVHRVFAVIKRGTPYEIRFSSTTA